MTPVLCLIFKHITKRFQSNLKELNSNNCGETRTKRREREKVKHKTKQKKHGQKG